METVTKSNSPAVHNNGLCRVCLSANEDNKCIFTLHRNFDHENYSFSNLCQKLQLYGGIEVAQNDGFPSKMCSECIWKMRIAHFFRVQCQETDRVLQAAYKNNLNGQCWTSEKVAHAKTKIGKIHELCSPEENREHKLILSPFTEITDPPHLSKDLGNIKISTVSKVGEEVLITTTDLFRAQKLVVTKKINFDKGPKLWRFCNDKTAKARLEPGQISKEVSAKVKEDAPLSKKEASRSRRLVVFKRVTSMQSLKNCKERQRQYIKKTVYAKSDSNDVETVQTGPNNSSGARRASDTGSVYKYKYSSKRPSEMYEFDHDCEEFSCDRCDTRFGRLNDFLAHAQLHDPKEKHKPAICKICNKKFRKAVTMIRHLNVHKRENPRAVYTILKDIRDRRNFKSFENPMKDGKNIQNLDKKIFPLGKCEGNFKNRRDFEADKLDVDANCYDDLSSDSTGAFNWERFGKRCSRDMSLQKRASSHEERTFTCTVCDAEVVGEKILKSHTENCGRAIEKTGQNPRYVVRLEAQNPPDDRSAIKLINIWMKEELDSDNEGKGFPCDSCNKSYVTKKSLSKHRAKMHENVSEKRITHRCIICDGKDCTCVERIKENRDGSQEKSKSHTCEECNKTFEKESKLEKHMGLHARAKEQRDTNFKRFLCHICSKTFRQNTGLVFHMRTHTGYKPHVCKYCGRGFTSNSNCINHERTHTGDRPFVCHFCSAAFAKSCTLKAHITTHTGEANYHCKTCGKSFRRLKYLKEHRFTHTGEKPYACKICGTAYSHSGSLFVHEKKCKAQQINDQTLSVPVPQNYCENQSVTIGEFSAAITPITGTLPASHDVISINDSLSTHENKNYVDGVTRISAHCASESTGTVVHPSTVSANVPSAGRNFTIIGQMFHT